MCCSITENLGATLKPNEISEFIELQNFLARLLGWYIKTFAGQSFSSQGPSVAGTSRSAVSGL